MDNFFDFSILSEPSFWIGTLIFSIIAYSIGSINAGQLLSSIGGKNLGKEGSKSYGATNAGRIYGKWAFVAVFAFDFFKALVTVVLLMLIKSASIGEDNKIKIWTFAYADINIAIMFVVIGHIFPMYFSFNGGKGVASAFGAVIALNWVFAIIAITVFLIVKLINGWTAWASIFGVAVGVFLIISLQWLFAEHLSFLLFKWSLCWTSMFSGLLVGSLVIGKHWTNVKRMINGEIPWSKKKRENK